LKLSRVFLLFACLTFVSANFTEAQVASPILSGSIRQHSKHSGDNHNYDSKRTCGTTEYLQRQEELYPELKQSREKLNSRIHSVAEQMLLDKKENRSIYTIPVVVHVVYKNGSENISMGQVQSQLDVLNRDFRKLNGDIALVPSVWSGIAADVGIEFCLAKRDPDGNPTDGVLRVPTTVSEFTMADEVKYSTSGGSDAWPADRYLNLWVCDLASGLLGYAQFPGGGSPSTDGVVIKYSNFGTTGTATPPYNLGRTATHEIAHWLNLLHIWGDEPQCAADDQVNDTPQQKDSNGGCPGFPLLSGSGSSCGDPNGSMFMNYMDYVHDNCMYMFTQGQKSVMLASLFDFRQSLLNSNVCSPLTPGDTLCDTAANFLSGQSQTIFRPAEIGTSGDGWVSGTNSSEHKAKADFFNLQLNNWQAIHGLYVYFGFVHQTNPLTPVYLKIWDNDGPNGTPGTILGSRTLTIANLSLVVQGALPAFVTFSPAIGTDGSFYAGVEFPGNGLDSVAIFTNNIGESPVNTAWEQWSDNTWHQYSDNDSWQISLSHAIFPVYCSVVGMEDRKSTDFFKVFPVPAENEVYLMTSEIINDIPQIQVLDISGKLIPCVSEFKFSEGLIKVNTAHLPSGLYCFRIGVSGKFYSEKVVIYRN